MSIKLPIAWMIFFISAQFVGVVLHEFLNRSFMRSDDIFVIIVIFISFILSFLMLWKRQIQTHSYFFSLGGKWFYLVTATFIASGFVNARGDRSFFLSFLMLTSLTIPTITLALLQKRDFTKSSLQRLSLSLNVLAASLIILSNLFVVAFFKDNYDQFILMKHIGSSTLIGLIHSFLIHLYWPSIFFWVLSILPFNPTINKLGEWVFLKK